jgi:uncharacterized protein with PIN domain
MLGRLARWLRTLGFDTAHEASISDADLVRCAFVEGRHILTRDRELFVEWRIDGGLLIGSDRPLEQLAEVIGAFRLAAPDRLFTRCRVCNAALVRLDGLAAAGRAPDWIVNRAGDLAECPDCGRIYWEGSHTDRMRSVLARSFPPPVGSSDRRSEEEPETEDPDRERDDRAKPLA